MAIEQAGDGTREQAVDYPSEENVDGKCKDSHQIGVGAEEVVADNICRFNDIEMPQNRANEA